MSKAKFELARELIQEKQYDEARTILSTIDHPKAQEWIAKIDDLDIPEYPEDDEVDAPRDGRLGRRAAMVLFVALIAIGLIAYLYFQSTFGAGNEALMRAMGH